jgi:hypothetical protein
MRKKPLTVHRQVLNIGVLQMELVAQAQDHLVRIDPHSEKSRCIHFRLRLYVQCNDVIAQSKQHGFLSNVIALQHAFSAICSTLPPTLQHSVHIAHQLIPMFSLELLFPRLAHSAVDSPMIPFSPAEERILLSTDLSAHPQPSLDPWLIPPVGAKDPDRQGLDSSQPLRNS